jgi:hypothetical protein
MCSWMCMPFRAHPLGKIIWRLCWVQLSLSYCQQSVDQFVLVSGSPLGPITRFYPYPFFSDNCFVVFPAGRHLWREDGSLTYSAIAEWSGHWGPITNHTLPSHLRLCSPFVASYDSQGLRWRYSNPPPQGEEWDISTISYIGIQFVPQRNHITSF